MFAKGYGSSDGNGFLTTRIRDQRIAVRRLDVDVDVDVARCAGGRTSIAQRKLSARSMLPLPAYCATCGYGHNGIVRSIPVSEVCNAVMRAGARPLRIH